MKSVGLSLLAAALLLAAQTGRAGEAIRLANHAALSPDDKTLAFDWDGDIWSVAMAGGMARRLTNHAARDREPHFSPDGKQLAFISEGSGSPQVHIMPAESGMPRQVTYHTAGCSLQDWCPDGRHLLINATRDHFWRHAERFFTINGESRQAEHLVFDDYGQNGCLSADGKRLLFTHESPAWWRKGYRGSQANQIRMFDLECKEFRPFLADETGCLWPLPEGLSAPEPKESWMWASLRVPYRGWFLVTNGEDMERNGAVPDHVVWPKPGQMPGGEDVQLSRAIEVLQTEVKTGKQRPRPSLHRATE